MIFYGAMRKERRSNGRDALGRPLIAIREPIMTVWSKCTSNRIRALKEDVFLASWLTCYKPLTLPQQERRQESWLNHTDPSKYQTSKDRCRQLRISFDREAVLLGTATRREHCHMR